MTTEKLLDFQTKRELLNKELSELEVKFLDSMKSDKKTDFTIASVNYIQALKDYSDFVEKFIEEEK